MPFEKGRSGNPAGRPRGISDRRATLSTLLAPDAPALVAKAVERALDGDPVLLKACLDKLIPNARPCKHLALDASKEGAEGMTDRVINAAVSASISLEDANSVLDLLAKKVRIDEVTELRARIERLEAGHESSA